MNLSAQKRFTGVCVAALGAAVTMTACSATESSTASPPAITKYVTVETHTMPLDRYKTLTSCIPMDSDAIRDPSEIGMTGLQLIGLREAIDTPQCAGAGFVAGSTEKSCTILFDSVYGTDGRKGVTVLKMNNDGTAGYTLQKEQTATDANNLIATLCQT